jgi:hypothetical protein
VSDQLSSLDHPITCYNAPICANNHHLEIVIISIDADIAQMFMFVIKIAHGQEMKIFLFFRFFLSRLELPSPQKSRKLIHKFHIFAFFVLCVSGEFNTLFSGEFVDGKGILLAGLMVS